MRNRSVAGDGKKRSVNLTGADLGPRLIHLKGWLFLAGGIGAGVALVLHSPTLETVALLVVAIYCFMRFYYFAFYVITHYVDDRYRFEGLASFAAYLWRERRGGPGTDSRQ